jgi:MoxR-like ATPase
MKHRSKEEKRQDRFIQINDKKVQLSLPYKAPDSPLIGRETELKHLISSFMRISDFSVTPSPPLLLGEPGVGKNKLVYALAKMFHQDLYIFQGTEDITGEDLIFTTRISDDSEKKIDYILSPLTTAMVRGAICYLDELGKIRHKALSPLASLLEERGYIDSIVLGERIEARPGFRFVSASNLSDFEREAFPGFIKDRVKPVIKMENLGRKEIEQIIRSRFRVLSENGAVFFKDFWDLCHENKKERMLTPRVSLQIVSHAIQLAHLQEWEANPPGVLEYKGVFRPIRKEHLEAAFQVISQGEKP